jgi:hypothetical protein
MGRGQVAPAAVADERDAAGERGVPRGCGPQVPGIDRIAVGSAEDDVERGERAVRVRLVAGQHGLDGARCGRLERALPERIEVVRRSGRRAVVDELGERKVEERHDGASLSGIGVPRASASSFRSAAGAGAFLTRS